MKKEDGMRGQTQRRSTRRYRQRWLIDAMVATIGIEYHQARLAPPARPAARAQAEPIPVDMRGRSRKR